VKRNPTATITPSSTTEPISAQVQIEGIRHTFTREGGWTVTWLTSTAPLTAGEAGYFTLDDAALGLLDAGLSFAP
jgi:hypothetical protein